MRVAYLILAHRFPDQVARLVRVLTAEDDTAFVHVDKSAPEAPFAEAFSALRADQMKMAGNRLKCSWGNISLIDATVGLMRQALADPRGFDYLALLSGQDYPVLSINTMKSDLAASNGLEFMENVPLPYDFFGESGGFNRINQYHYTPIYPLVAGRKGENRIIGLANRILQYFPKKERLDGYILAGGSQWWTLTSACAKSMLTYLASHPEFERFYRYALVPDEMFFQTLIRKTPYAEHLASNNRRFIKWQSNKPLVMDIKLTEDALASGMHFARKFNDASLPNMLNFVDERLAGQSEIRR